VDGMRAIRVVMDSTGIPNQLLNILLSQISWDFRGTISLESGDLLIMCECMSLNTPPPPPGFSVSGITIERHIETWTNDLVKHTILILRFNNKIFGKYFTNYDLVLMAGTNFTSKGLVVQVSGGKDGLMTLLKDIKETQNVRSVASAKGAKGMITNVITSKEYRVLNLAYSNGWYRSPKKTNLRSLAKELGMSKSSVANYLNSSENQIISDYIDPK